MGSVDISRKMLKGNPLKLRDFNLEHLFVSDLLVGVLHPQLKGFSNSGVVISGACLWLQKTRLLEVIQR